MRLILIIFFSCLFYLADAQTNFFHIDNVFIAEYTNLTLEFDSCSMNLHVEYLFPDKILYEDIDVTKYQVNPYCTLFLSLPNFGCAIFNLETGSLNFLHDNINLIFNPRSDYECIKI